MEIIFRSVSPGVHCYSPFPKSATRDLSINLAELCKSVILKHITIGRLATSIMKLPLPKRLLQYIAELSTTDFEQIECAPFSDAFSFNFFHRALTYRVICLRDGLEYMITYGYSPVENVKLKIGHEEWVKVQHNNVMCICATVKDPLTENVFYVYHQPYASLEQLWSVFCKRNPPVPETFFVRLTSDLCEALRHIRSNGLHYSHFGLDNIFVVNDRLVLENGLMHKSTKFIADPKKAYCLDEKGMLCDIANILKLLLQNYANSSSHSKTLCRLLHDIENQKCIDSLLHVVNHSQENVKSFSFVKLIQNLLS